MTAIAAHSFTEDGETRVVERTAPGIGVVSMPTSAQIAAESTAGLYPTSAIDVQGKARITIKTSFSVASASCPFRVLMYDANGDLIGCMPSVSEVYTAIASDAELDEDSRYIGSMFLFSNEGGIASLKIRMTSTPSSGNISFFVAGV